MSVSVNEPHKSREEAIRERAHDIWLERMARGQPGTAESDWHLAELEVGRFVMTLEFVKAHTGKDGRHYTAGQIADITDATVAQELISQGIAKQQQSGSKPAEPSKGQDPSEKKHE